MLIPSYTVQWKGVATADRGRCERQDSQQEQKHKEKSIGPFGANELILLSVERGNDTLTAEILAELC
jgi:hypothetical protein